MEVDNDNCDKIGLRVTAFAAMGSRKYMEDTFSVAYQKSDNGKGLDYAYFGIFDGHGGYSASQFAKEHLMNFIVDAEGFWSDNDAHVLDAIKRGFLECHQAMWKDLDKWPPTTSGLPSTAGTTASVAFLRKGKLYLGHCGDSGIVLGRTNPRGGKWISQPLTTEHKPESPEELSRIESYGGKVQQKQGIHRVVWYRPKNPHQGPIRRNTRIEEVPFLAVARSLGDLWSYNYKTEKFVVSPEPDVEVIEVDNLSFKCLIFASDGLWNVIDPETSVDSVYQTEMRNDHNAKLGINTWRNPSRILVETALEKWRSNGLRADNTSVVCVMLDPPNKRNLFKFNEAQEGARTIFDYSTSEAYNLDYMTGAEVYPDALTKQNAQVGFFGEPPLLTYPNYYETTYGYQMGPSTSQQVAEPGALTYQTSSNESAFVKACCRNNYQLASASEQIPCHTSYEQHREFYENLSSRPFPPLHYAYRPVLPLPSLHPNIYENPGYTYKMERYNYLRPTPEELAAMHNEEDEEESDTDVDFSDTDEEIEPEVPEKSSDDSIQIFEISSSAEVVMTSEEEKPTKSNNKENTDRRKKEPIMVRSRFYATRQTDRKMRSGAVGSSGIISKAIGREKSQRKATKNIRKVVKTMQTAGRIQMEAPRVGPKKATVENKPREKRVLRSAPVKEANKNIKELDVTSQTSQMSAENAPVARSLRSNSSNSNVMEKSRKRGIFESVGKDRRLK